MERLNLVGEQCGRLKVIAFAGIIKGHSHFRCLCGCGNEKVVSSDSLRGKDVKSCGCLRREVTAKMGRASRKHGKHRSRVYACWQSLLDRCRNPKSRSFADYGGRGIKVCERWFRFEGFYADMGDPPPGLSIDRIDNDGDYKPSNCRWTDKTQQARNRRPTLMVEWEGHQRCLIELCEERGVNYQTAYSRLTRDGLTIQQVLDPSIGCFFRDNNPRDKFITHEGRSQKMKDWAKEVGMKVGTLSYRLCSGWSVELALTTPVKIKAGV